ncbi:PLP-dependent aminotransferase family protein [Rhodococcus sp. HNM0563]|uniref:aminotransferase-like domain-containing protein n=1 Tax=Rhodococcus sp. HNM0563 TaxID=2716339 RepID=UPI00146CB652|nr:PLP-dependent aminotransferase family protein [Rhodococcus sp. HNM0563]NLU63563.1 PLP-dependent aminotransferase family protein [Rhodococcus sp. HNM0563]
MRDLAHIAQSPIRQLLALTASRSDVISLAGGLPAPEAFDVRGIGEAFAHVLATDGAAALQYSPTEGNEVLRSIFAERSRARGLAASAGTVLVTSGAQQALTLLSMVLLEPRDVVVVEAPTYLAALQCFQIAGAHIIPVSSDSDGIDIESLTEVVARERPKMLYLVPTFANPTGRSVSDARRAAIAELADRFGFWIVEDDPYSELRYAGGPQAAVGSHEGADGRSIYCGSLSKVCAPGLRLGWMHGPAKVIAAASLVKQAMDLHTSTIDQAAAAHYLQHADVDQQIGNLRSMYQLRRDAMSAALHRLLPGTEWTEPRGGMFVWLRLGWGVNTTDLLPRAIDAGVAFVPGESFYATCPDTSTLRLSFTTYHPDLIDEGIARLSGVLNVAG